GVFGPWRRNLSSRAPPDCRAGSTGHKRNPRRLCILPRTAQCEGPTWPGRKPNAFSKEVHALPIRSSSRRERSDRAIRIEYENLFSAAGTQFRRHGAEADECKPIGWCVGFHYINRELSRYWW